MPFRGSERGGSQRASNITHLERQGGALTPYRGASARDPLSTMGAYQYGARTGTTGGLPIRAQGGQRRPTAPNPQAENRDYFDDVLMKRFGGDESLRGRLIGMYNEFGGKSDPTGAVDWYESWSGDPYKGNIYNQGEYDWAKRRGEEFRAGEQADALDNWSGGGAGVPPTVSQGFV